MGNCCSGAATVPSSSSPPSPVAWSAPGPSQQPNVSTVSCPIRASSSTVEQREELQVFRGNAIRASIEAGRNGYWRNLCSKVDFMDKPLKNCVDVIHTDIVDIWNLNDANRYLLSDQFKISMSHVVKDLAVPTHGTSRGPDLSGDENHEIAKWVYAAYEGRQETLILPGDYPMLDGLHCRPPRYSGQYCQDCHL